MNHPRNRDLCCDSVVQNIRDIASMTFSVPFGRQQRIHIQCPQTKLASEISAGCLIEASKTSLPPDALLDPKNTYSAVDT